MSLTLTVAKSGNVHTRWGARKNYKSQKVKNLVVYIFMKLTK